MVARLEISDWTHKTADFLIVMLKVRGCSLCFPLSILHGYYRSSFEYFEVGKVLLCKQKILFTLLDKKSGQ